MPRRMLFLAVLAATASFFIVVIPTWTAPVPAKKPVNEITNSIGMKLVRIEPGKFTMGCSKAEQEAVIAEYENVTGIRAPDAVRERCRAQGPEHAVEITKTFWLSVHEVTQRQFQNVMGYNPSFFSRDGEGKIGAEYPYNNKPAGGKEKVPANTALFPVENVSWDEANEFCTKLNALPGEKRYGRKYRLPSEAEWEYACRGEASSLPFHFGASLSFRQANFSCGIPWGGGEKGVRLGRTCPVGSYEKNRFGLFDMHGNVYEWCADWYGKDYYEKSPRQDPPGPREGAARVTRGGSWISSGGTCRSAQRSEVRPTVRGCNIGIRIALTPSSK